MKNIRSSVILLGAALGLAGMGGTQSAHAASSTINIDFQAGPTGNGDAINYSGTAADSDTGTMWNIIAPPNDNSYAQYGGGTGGIVTGTIAVSDLLYSDGSASTISLTGTNTGGNLSAYASASATGPAQDAYGLMNDYLIAQNGSTRASP